MTIRARLLLALGVLAVVIVALVVTGWAGLAFSERSLTTIHEDRVLPLRQLKATSEAYSARIVSNAAKLREGLISWEQAGSGVAQAREDVDRQWRAYLATYLTDAEKGLVARAAEMKATADATVDTLQAILSARDHEGLVQWIKGELFQAIDPLIAEIDAIADLQTSIAAAEIARARTVIGAVQLTFAVLVLIGFASIAVSGWAVTHRISRPLRRVIDAMQRLASGDTGAIARAAGQPVEIADMFNAIEVFRRSRVDAERQEAERRANDEWLRRMLDELPLAVTLFDDDERVLLRNAEMHRLVPIRDPARAIGMSLEEITREAITAAGFLDPVSAELRVAALLTRYRGAEDGRFESNFRPDRIYSGHFRWIGRRLVVALADDTPIRTAQLASAQAELRLKLAVQALPVSFSLFTADRKLMILNREFQKEFQYLDGEIRTGMALQELFDAHARRSDIVISGATAAEITKAKADAEFRRELTTHLEELFFSDPEIARDQTAAGRTYRMRRTRLPNGDVVRVSLDITDLKAKEAQIEALGQTALARRTLLLREVLDAIPDSIAVLNQEFKLAFANRGLARMIGLDIRELPGMGLLDLLRRLSIDPADVADLLVDGPRKGEVELASLDGRSPLKISTSPVPTGEILFAITDMTAQRGRESERLEHQKRLAHADKTQALVTLAGSIAHDFNNLLGVIDGFATMAHEDATALVAAEDSPIARGIVSGLDRVLSGAGRARQIVQSLNTLTRERELPSDEIDLRQAVDDACQLLGVLVPSSVRLVHEVPEEPCLALSNLVQVEQIVTNLVINGVHALGSGTGTVTVRLEILDLDGGRAEGLRSTEAAAKRTGYYIEPSGDGSASLFAGVLEPSRYIRLTISDQGSGMSEETLRRVLNPFFTTKEPGRGTGLGLASVLDIVMAHRGGLHIRTRLGIGTDVMILIPEATPAIRALPGSRYAPSEDQEADHDDEMSVECRILIVDDEQMLVDLAARTLDRLGHEVEGYTDPRVALERLVGDPDGFDLVVTDYTMPDMSGREMVERITAIRPDLPVVVATGSPSVLRASEPLPLSVRRVLAKPYKPFQLVQAVREALGEYADGLRRDLDASD